MGKQTVISAKHLKKSFGSQKNIQIIYLDLNIDIYKGDFTVIMDSSGAGKSTLMYSLSGMDQPDGGQIDFDGTDITKLNSDRLAVFRRKQCGFVFQQIYLIDKMSLMDNVITAGALTSRNKEDIRNRAKQLFSLVNISENIWKKTSSQISGGEAQRAGIVRAVINQPNVLFADEPTGSLNSANGTAVLDVFSSLHEKGQSIVMVTHDQKSALRGSRILYMKDGTIFGECNLGKFEPDHAERTETFEKIHCGNGVVSMMKTKAFAWHNLKKAKGQYASFALIICLTAFIINIAFVLAFQTFEAYDSLFGELDTADVNFMIPQSQDDHAILDAIEEIDGIASAEKHNGIFVPATVREFADSEFDMNTVFYNLDEARTLNRFTVLEYLKKDEHTVYIPMFMKELGGFREGGSITYSVGEADHTYEIGGTVSEMQYGNYGTGLIGGYFPAAAYENFAAKHREHTVAEYSVRAAGNADLVQIKKDITAYLNDKEITALNINDKAAVRQTRTMVCTLLIVIFLALAAIILAVSIFLSGFRIRSTIEDELAQMGVLKAVGYTSQMIICSTVLPYLLTGCVSAVLGVSLSYVALPGVAAILAIQSGFLYTPAFDIAALLITVTALTSIIGMFAYISAMKLYRLEPINANFL